MARCYLWWLGVLGAACGARELDPAACAARFDVQRDKIIRTEESRDMGARYLSELDVGARTECLRLCCETEACDVFVYEEKGPGSCYLFACGPPEDFRCKFTAHGNFSSGVLALSRRLAELQDRERDRDRDLPSPRSTSIGPRPPPPTQRASTTAAPPHADLLLTPSAGRCSRYQFECRRGGECIAVYNACDGVPQCADGSDEAPDLACPPPPPPPHPAPTPAPAPAPAPSRTTPPPRPRPAQGSPDSELEAAAAMGSHSRWPHRLTQAQPQPQPQRYPVVGGDAYDQPVVPEGARGSHIFSHKGGLVQETEGAPYPPFEPPAPPPWPHRAWPPHPPPPHRIESESAEGGGYPRPDWNEEARRAWPVPLASDPEVVYPGGAGPEQAHAATLRDSVSKGRPSASAQAQAPERARPVQADTKPRNDSPNHKPHKDKVLEPLAHVSVDVARDAADGLSEHPPAAVLLLVLGMAMTVGLGAMLSCRMSAARRRLRRGGKPFAHDADYLVNGMYL